MHTLIVGGGLSGLALADGLAARGQDYLLVEARNRFGGRIHTKHHGSGYFDMGPAWFWEGQPRIAAYIQRFGLEKFDQYAHGDVTFENERGHVQRGRGLSSMQGAWRLAGGLGSLTQALADRIPEDRKRLNTRIVTLSKTEHGISAKLGNGEVFNADRVVLALPPRIAAQMTFEPALPNGTIQSMQAVSTWMAGQAKAVAVYDTAFWRGAGLSGDATSRFGPMVEVHDASPAKGGPYALFGFIGVAPQNRRDEDQLRQQLLAQLERLFGPKAARPAQLYIKDWAVDPFTSTQADQAPLYAHPAYGLPRSMTNLWDNKLLFAGTEVAPQFGGYVEGALEAAENLLHAL